MDNTQKARSLLRDFKGEHYVFGAGALQMTGEVTAAAGSRAVLVCDTFPGSDTYRTEIVDSLRKSKVQIAATVTGAKPNCPREDVFRIGEAFTEYQPDVVVSFGGGSTIDAGKAAEVLRTLGGGIESYFDTGRVTEALAKSGKKLCHHVAIQTAASSGAHLTKYSNITDVASGQKKLIVDEAIVPSHPMFDYRVTYSAPRNLILDGAMDGIAHALEVLYGAAHKPSYAKVREIAETGIQLVVNNLPCVIENPSHTAAREALCLATDLGGYSIMVGGTNGGHLTSFSLVDVLSHGRACAMMNPYYSVFFAPAIEDALQLVGGIYRQAGYGHTSLEKLHGRELGIAVAECMFELSRKIGFPTTLREVPGVTRGHIARALEAAKDPQLKMKLQNMPVPLTAEMVDEYMGPVLEAAFDGDLSRIKNV